MLSAIGDYFQHFLSDPCLLLFVLASICLASALLSLHKENAPLPKFLLTLGGLLLVTGYAIMIPAASSFQIANLPQFNLVHLTLNLAWFSLGAGFFLSSIRSQNS